MFCRRCRLLSPISLCFLGREKGQGKGVGKGKEGESNEGSRALEPGCCGASMCPQAQPRTLIGPGVPLDPDSGNRSPPRILLRFAVNPGPILFPTLLWVPQWSQALGTTTHGSGEARGCPRAVRPPYGCLETSAGVGNGRARPMGSWLATGCDCA